MKLLTVLTVLSVLVAAAKIFAFWAITYLKSKPKSKIYAEDIIKAQKVKAAPEIIPIVETLVETPRIISHEKPNLREYDTVQYRFKCMLQARVLTRTDLKAIQEYLVKNVRYYEKKRFKNEAHAIYSILKWAELEQLQEVNNFLNTKELKLYEKPIIQSRK